MILLLLKNSCQRTVVVRYSPFPVKVDRRGFGRYRADDYDTLADCPVEMGTFWSARFTAGGMPHRFVVAGAAASF